MLSPTRLLALPVFAAALLLSACTATQVVPYSADVRLVTSAAAFDSLLAAEPLLLVDFYADWCGPCQYLKPTINALAADYRGRVVVAAVDVDGVPALASRYDISAIPAVYLFARGQKVQSWRGVKERATYEAELSRLAPPAPAVPAAPASPPAAPAAPSPVAP